MEPPFPSFRYHPHQEAGIAWMMEREKHGIYCYGGILADEMGLGKTWQTVGLLLNCPRPCTLLLVPPILMGQWKEVLHQSDIPYNLHNSATVRGIPSNRAIRVVLTTYDRAVRHATELRRNNDVDRIICDEGHVLRNKGTRRFRELLRIPAKYRWILSGTPVQNRQADFVNLLEWMEAGYDPDYTPLSIVAEEIMLRRTVADIRDVIVSMPVKPTHSIHPVVMEGEEKRIFDILVRRFNDAVMAHVEQWQILEQYLRIRQFLAHPQIYMTAIGKKYKKSTESTKWTGTASKMAKLTEFLHSTPKRPTLLFTTFRDEMNYAEAICREAGYTTWRICGNIGAAGIERAVRESRDCENAAVLVQIQAGNAGLNLQHLSRVIFLSSHWNPAVVDQAIGRSYRIGQTEAVEVHHILLADGAEKNLDRHMAGLHAQKRGIAKAICKKLVCDSAIDAHTIFAELNAICPDEVERLHTEQEEAELAEPATKGIYDAL